jgi:hypothetical protein
MQINVTTYTLVNMELGVYICECKFLLRLFEQFLFAIRKKKDYFFGGTGVWTQDLKLALQVLYHLSYVPALKDYLNVNLRW